MALAPRWHAVTWTWQKQAITFNQLKTMQLAMTWAMLGIGQGGASGGVGLGWRQGGGGFADLGNSSAQALCALGTPVASGEGVAQALGDGVLVDGVGDVDVLAPVHAALHIVAHILLQLAEQQAEEARQQRAPQVQALVGVVVPVILGAPPQGDQQQPVDHVAEEICLQPFQCKE